MTDEEIHNIYLHMSGKAEGIAEATGTADFPVLFARAILELDRLQRHWTRLSVTEIETVFGDDMSRQMFRYALELEKLLKEKNK